MAALERTNAPMEGALAFPVLPTLQVVLYSTDAVASSAALHGADLGVEHVGPAGLARRLATGLGVVPDQAPRGVRVAAMDQRLATLDDGARWFSRSREADRFGVAEWFVGVADGLRAAGWDGGALGGSLRLEAISAAQSARVTPAFPPGEADHWHVLLDELRTASLPFWLDLQLACRREDLSPIVARVVEALEASGHAVSELAPATAALETDLGRLRRGLLGGVADALVADGTVRFVVADTPIEAAAFCASLTAEPDAIVATGEAPLLDEVRARVGAPRLGLAKCSRWRPALQVLPLALELAFTPRDPHAALELLTLPVSPVPGRVRGALARALGEQPAVGGPLWKAGLEDAVAAWREVLEGDPAAREVALRRTLGLLFPDAPADASVGAPAADLVVLAEAIAAWARGRAATSEEGVRALLAAARVAEDLAAMLRVLPVGHRVSRLAARQLHDLAAGEGVASDAFAEAGAPLVVSDPAAVPEGAGHVLWFGFVEGAAEVGAPFPWTAEERAALLAAGVTLDEEGARRRREERAWLRPAIVARERLTLVSWRTAGVEAIEPHPLLDVLAARFGVASVRACTVGVRALLAKDRTAVDVVAAAPVSPRTRWQVPAGAIEAPGKVSATQIESLLGCPLRWTLEYAAGLRPGGTEALPDLDRMVGTFAHALLQDLLLRDDPPFAALTPVAARAALLDSFDRRVATEASPLLLPGSQSLGRQVRARIAEAGVALVERLQAGGWAPRAKEAPVSGTFAALPFGGSADLTLSRADGAVGLLDLKKGGRASKEAALREGRALQLALYARGLGVDRVHAGYFIIEEGRLVTADGDAWPGAWSVTGPCSSETLLHAERAWAWWLDAMRAGDVVKRDDLDALDLAETTVAAGRPPPETPWDDKEATCRFCAHARLCSFDNGATESA